MRPKPSKDTAWICGSTENSLADWYSASAFSQSPLKRAISALLMWTDGSGDAVRAGVGVGGSSRVGAPVKNGVAGKGIDFGESPTERLHAAIMRNSSPIIMTNLDFIRTTITQGRKRVNVKPTPLTILDMHVKLYSRRKSTLSIESVF